MIKNFILIAFLSCLLACSAQQENQADTNPTVLVFTKTEGYRHDSISEGIALFKTFAEENKQLNVITTEDSTQFSSAVLKDVSVVVFLNTTGDILNESQQEALRQFIQNGGGFMGIHAATDTEYGWPWYGQMIGARFTSHPAIQEAKLQVLSKEHPSSKHLPDEWIRTDEWYNFRDIQDDIKPLINLDESSYKGGENGEKHPIAWYHEFEGGRIFYTAGGHTPESYSDSLFIKHLRGGLEYVLN